MAALPERGGCLTGTGWLLYWNRVAALLERGGCLTGAGSAVLSGTGSAVLSSAGSAVLSGSACNHHPFVLLYYFIIFFEPVPACFRLP